MGTRKSKHNKGRKPLYKEHGAADVVAEKRAHLIDAVSEEIPDAGNDLPVPEPVTFGLMRTDKVYLRKEIKPDPPSPSFDDAAPAWHGRVAGQRGKRNSKGSMRAKSQANQMRRFAVPQYRPLNKRPAAIGSRRSEELSRRELEFILGAAHWAKTGRVHYVSSLLSKSGGMPDYMAEIDPLELMLLLETIDFNKLTNRFLKLEAARGRNQARKA